MTSYNWTGVIFDSTPLTLAMQMTALGVALGTWLVALSVKFIPARFFVWWRIPEDEESASKNRFNDMLSKAASVDTQQLKDQDD